MVKEKHSTFKQFSLGEMTLTKVVLLYNYEYFTH